MFFMITGMLFLRKEMHIEAKDYFFKYMRRGLMALLTFGIPYAALKIVMTQGLNISLLSKSVLAVVSDSGFGHLWYLYVLIAIYWIMPVLKNFSDKATDDEMKLVLIMLFVFDFCTPLLSRLFDYRVAFCGQILYPTFYVLMGHWLYENRQGFDVRNLCLAIVFCVLLILGINVFDFKSEAWVQYDSPIIAVLAVSIFGLFITREWKDIRFLWTVDRLCFGAYLIHPLFIQFTYRFLKVTPINFSLYPVVTVLFAMFFIGLSFAASWIMRKNEFLRKYVL